MRYIMTFIWSFALVSVLNYVVSSVQGAQFHFAIGAYLSVVVAILLFIIDAVLPKEEKTAAHH